MNDIGWAVKQMWHGEKVRRAGWNVKGMFLILIPEGYLGHPVLEDGAPAQPYVAMYTVQKSVVPWLCSQPDLLALDWEIAE